MSDQVTITDEDGVRWIEIDRPESRNGLTPEINTEVIAAINGAAASTRSRVVVISGAGGVFSSGLDLKDAMPRGVADPEQLKKTMDEHFHALIRALRNAPMPTVAAVDGIAAGFGCDLALACDVRLLSERARFSEIFVRRGLIPDGGGTFFLPRLIGVGRALEFMYTGELVGAQIAYEIGLGNQVFNTHEFRDRAWSWAKKVANGPPLAHRLIKQAVYAGLDGTLDDALAREQDGQLKCLASRDFAEGVAAFLQKREPVFTGE